MTTLHMDQDNCQNLETRLESTQVAIKNSLRGITSITEGIVGGAWVSSSALEYLEQFNNYGNTLRSQAEELEGLASKLRAEIEAWRSAAAKLGF
jgi:hypothetical protein